MHTNASPDRAGRSRRRNGRRFSPLLASFAVVFVACFGISAALAVVDPLDLYLWGATPKFAPGGYRMDDTPYLVDAVTKSPGIDTILIGGSTADQITAPLMEQLLPGTHHAFNISYAGPRPQDTAIVMRRVEQSRAVRHVLVELSWIYVLPMDSGLAGDAESTNFPTYLYDKSVLNDVRAINLGTMIAGAQLLTGRPIDPPQWRRRPLEKRVGGRYAAFQAPPSLERIKQMIARHRKDIDRAATHSCADYGLLNDALVPFARTMSRRGVRVDVIVPVYSMAAYYDWADNVRFRRMAGSSLVNDELLMRRCAVEALYRIPNVRVFDFDDVPGLAEDLRNYYEVAHAYNTVVYRYMLKSVAGGHHQLTSANVDSRLNALRQRIINYELVDSKLWAPPKQ